MLIFVSAFVLCVPILGYIGIYNRGMGPLALVFVSVLAVLLVTGCVVLLLIFRIATLRLFQSPLILASVAILAGQLQIYSAVYHGIDLYRLFSNLSFYQAKVEASSTSPRFITFDWGSAGFAGQSSWRYLLFDETGHATNPPPGTESTATSLMPSSNCSMTISHLWDRFYSVSVNC
ncbi:MAG: hypothetical protein IJ935_01900 [Afipia sp.]|nr:hypothetical protein [Afipia sp.]